MPRFRLPRVTRLLVASLITLSLGLAIWVGHPVHALPAADGLGSPLSVMVSPDGAHAYVASIGDRGLGVFARDEATGALQFIEAQLDGAAGLVFSRPSSAALSPDGGHVYMTDLDLGMALFTRDGVTGALTFQAKTGSPSQAIALSPDGMHVYAAKAFVSRLFVFQRNPATGFLSFIEEHLHNQNGVNGLDTPLRVALSPDGAHVYVASAGQHFGDAGVGVFRRDVTTGQLTFLEAQLEGVGGVSGLAFARWVAVSPDGASVYVVSHDEYDTDDAGALAVFSRDPNSGALAFAEKHVDGVGGVDGLAEPRSVAVSPDGAHVYVASYGDDAVAAFRRDATTGTLTFVDAVFEGVDGVEGLREAYGVALSPDGAHLYATSTEDHALAAFARDAATGELSFVGVLFDSTSFTVTGKRLVLRNRVPDKKERNAGTWSSNAPLLVEPERDDPRCGDDPAGTIRATIRFFSSSSGQDTGEIPLPCQNWTVVRKNLGYKYQDRELDDGPCESVLVRHGKRTKARCLGKGAATDFLYDLSVGTDEGSVNVILTLDNLRYCTAFDDFRGRNGSDGKRFQGKDPPPPAACPPLGGP